jgi:hypothetical protein
VQRYEFSVQKKQLFEVFATEARPTRLFARWETTFSHFTTLIPNPLQKQNIKFYPIG